MNPAVVQWICIAFAIGWLVIHACRIEVPTAIVCSMAFVAASFVIGALA